jgi:hypothetical protein
MDKEGRPNAGQGEEEEHNYFHQPGPEPGLEPMDEEGRPNAGQGKVEEGNYVRNKNRSIACKLCIIFDIDILKEILKTVLEPVYFKAQGVKIQRAVLTAW